MSSIRVYRSTDQSIPDQTQTTIDFNQTDFVDGSDFSRTSGDIEVNFTGQAIFTGGVQWSPSTGGFQYRHIEIRDDQGNLLTESTVYPADTTETRQQIVAILPVTDGRRYQIRVFQDTDSTLTVEGSQAATWFGAVRI